MTKPSPLRNQRRRVVSRLIALLALTVTLPLAADDREERPNVLFIAIDDLRNDLGALGVAHARTPQLDRLARTSRLFSRHYVQVPTCGASRCSLLRGRYPDANEYLANGAIRDTSTDWADVSLPGWLRQQGYLTLALGKITHHPGGMVGGDWDALPEELPDAWDRSWLPDTPWETGQGIMHGYAHGKRRERGMTPPFEAGDFADTAYPDAWVADAAVRQLQTLAQETKPWFFGVGFFKPHLPFAAPKSWFEQHDPADFPAPPADPAAASRPGWHESRELGVAYDNGGRDVRTDAAYARELRRAYAAAVSYMDHQVGRVLDALAATGQAENTIVVVWSDHGFQLGEHDMWGKHTLYEQALRSPLMVRYPGLQRPGETSDAIVETVDLYPTLLDLCDLPAPAGVTLDGRSLRPQLSNPSTPGTKPAKGFWRDHRTVRDERWRLTVYPENKDREVEQIELFDLINDPSELKNRATSNPDVVARLRSFL